MDDIIVYGLVGLYFIGAAAHIWATVSLKRENDRLKTLLDSTERYVKLINISEIEKFNKLKDENVRLTMKNFEIETRDKIARELAENVRPSFERASKEMLETQKAKIFESVAFTAGVLSRLDEKERLNVLTMLFPKTKDIYLMLFENNKTV